MPNYPDKLLEEIGRKRGFEAYQQVRDVGGEPTDGLTIVKEDCPYQFVFSDCYVDLSNHE